MRNASAAIASVIIPAHNEELTIERCLESVLAGATPGELDVIVACNGCTDRTAEIAGSFGPDVRVVETAVASKIAALNLADSYAKAFPRMYVDADVTVSRRAVQHLAEEMQSIDAACAAPQLLAPKGDYGPVLAAYYRVWLKSPYFSRNLVGSGFYGLSKAGRARFEDFPDVMADDRFVANLFDDTERFVGSATFTPTFPSTLRSLIEVQARRTVASISFGAAIDHGEVDATDHQSSSRWLGRLASSPRQLPSVAAFIVVRAVSRARAEVLLRRGDRTWTRDRSSRT